MGKIATKAFCNSLQSGSFSGDTTQCPTKSEIEGAGFVVKGSYASNQLVQEEDVYYLFWEYTFSVSPSGNTTMDEAGDTQVYSVTSYKVQYQSSSTGIREEVDRQDVGYSSSHSGPGSWNSGNDTLTISSNDTPSSRSGSITFTQNESSKKQQVTYSQAAGNINWGTITITSFTVNDIPASGGSISSGNVSYTQQYGYGSANTGYTSTSGASVSYGTAVSAGSRGTTTGTRKSVGTLTVTVSRGGHSDNDSATVYQEENTRWTTGTDWNSWGPWSVYVSCSPRNLGNTGGTVTITRSASRTRSGTINYAYDSGATSTSSTSDSDSATPSLSYSVTSGSSSGVSLSGTTLTVGSSTEDRTIRVTGSYGGASDYDTVNQTGVTITYKYFVSISGGDSFSSSGGSGKFSVNSYGEEYWDGSRHDTFDCGWRLSESGDTGYLDLEKTTGTGSDTVDYTADPNSSTSTSRSITVTITNTSSSSVTDSDTVTISAARKTFSGYQYEFKVSDSSLSFSSDGETQSVTVTSRKRLIQWYDNDNGEIISEGSWSNVSYSSSVSGTGFSKGTGDSVTASKNTGTSGRSGTWTFTQISRTNICTHNSYSSDDDTEKVDLQQNGAVVVNDGYQYEFSVSPTSLSFSSSGGTQSVTVTSRKRLIQWYEGNSTPFSTGNWSNVTPTYSITSGNSYFSNSGSSVTASSNSSTSTRSGNLKISQSQTDICTLSGYGSDSTPINVPLSQSGRTITTMSITISVRNSSNSTLYSVVVNASTANFTGNGNIINGLTLTSGQTVSETISGLPIPSKGQVITFSGSYGYSSSGPGGSLSISPSGYEYFKNTTNISISISI